MMMRRLNRYIGKTVFFSICGTIMVLVSLGVISSLITEVGELKGNYTFSKAMLYVALNIPKAINEILSYGTFVGCVIGLGIHANANEIVVIRAAGVSMLRLTWAVLRPVIFVIGLGMLWGEYITPQLTQFAEASKEAAQLEGGGKPQFENRSWHREKNVYMRFDSVQKGKIIGIIQFKYDDNGELLSSFFAEQAIFQAEKNTWQLEQVDQSVFQDGRVDTFHFTSLAWDTALTPEQLDVLVASAENLSIRSLYYNARYRDQQGLDSRRYWLSFWKKVLQPLIVIGLALVGMSFIFGSLRESTMGFRLTLAVMVGFVFKVIQDFLGSSSAVFGFNPLFAVLVPALICCLIGIVLLRRA